MAGRARLGAARVELLLFAALPWLDPLNRRARRPPHRPGRRRLAGGPLPPGRGTERQQLTWLVLAAALTGLSMVAAAVVIAVLRYRLYDLDTLTAEVLAVVDQAMQPTRSSLWLRPRPGQGVR